MRSTCIYCTIAVVEGIVIGIDLFTYLMVSWLHVKEYPIMAQIGKDY